MVSRAAAEQFKGTSYEVKKYSYVSTKESIVQMIAEAKREDKVVVVFTTVLDAIREKIIEECEKNELPYIDVLAPLLNKFSDLLEMKPVNEP
ncbi:Bifunctional kinase-pyrophosphorylase like protein, partial [Aduncisulcus paluster]